jgi:hypothetical protein
MQTLQERVNAEHGKPPAQLALFDDGWVEVGGPGSAPDAFAFRPQLAYCPSPANMPVVLLSYGNIYLCWSIFHPAHACLTLHVRAQTLAVRILARDATRNFLTGHSIRMHARKGPRRERQKISGVAPGPSANCPASAWP